MHFHISTDRALIRSVITHVRLYPHLADDFSPLREHYQVPESVTFIEVRDGEELLGFFGLTEENGICWKLHTCLLPSAWGERAQRAAEQFREWLWQNSRCRRLITDVPSDNRLALRFAKHGGMTEYGINPKSFLRRGQLLDQVCLGISKAEGVPCP